MARNGTAHGAMLSANSAKIVRIRRPDVNQKAMFELGIERIIHKRETRETRIHPSFRFTPTGLRERLLLRTDLVCNLKVGVVRATKAKGSTVCLAKGSKIRSAGLHSRDKAGAK